MRYRLTKSKFILGLQCEKALYLDVYKPHLAYFPAETLALFRRGRQFEASVKAQFPMGIDISQRLGRQIERYPDLTATLLSQKGEVTLFEAGFIHNQVLILADVVHKSADNQLAVYEIKNSTSVKEVFRRDVNIQHYVISHALEQANHTIQKNPIQLCSFSVLYNNGSDGVLREELLPDARTAEPMIAEQVARFHQVLQGLEPDIAIGDHCSTPYDCPYRRYCSHSLTTQLDLPFATVYPDEEGHPAPPSRPQQHQ